MQNGSFELSLETDIIIILLSDSTTRTICIQLNESDSI
jgi:hypothetical protein